MVLIEERDCEDRYSCPSQNSESAKNWELCGPCRARRTMSRQRLRYLKPKEQRDREERQRQLTDGDHLELPLWKESI